MKIAKNEKEAWDMQDFKEGEPHGWIQWKGTDVCMDIKCECGCCSHVDSTFAYYVKCPKCGTVYMVNGHVEFIKMEGKKLSLSIGEVKGVEEKE